LRSLLGSFFTASLRTTKLWNPQRKEKNRLEKKKVAAKNRARTVKVEKIEEEDTEKVYPFCSK